MAVFSYDIGGFTGLLNIELYGLYTVLSSGTVPMDFASHRCHNFKDKNRYMQATSTLLGFLITTVVQIEIKLKIICGLPRHRFRLGSHCRWTTGGSLMYVDRQSGRLSAGFRRPLVFEKRETG